MPCKNTLFFLLCSLIILFIHYIYPLYSILLSYFILFLSLFYHFIPYAFIQAWAFTSLCRVAHDNKQGIPEGLPHSPFVIVSNNIVHHSLVRLTP